MLGRRANDACSTLYGQQLCKCNLLSLQGDRDDGKHILFPQWGIPVSNPINVNLARTPEAVLTLSFKLDLFVWSPLADMSHMIS